MATVKYLGPAQGVEVGGKVIAQGESGTIAKEVLDGLRRHGHQFEVASEKEDGAKTAKKE